MDTWNRFVSKVRDLIDKFVPSKLSKQLNEPRWYDNETRKALKKRRALHSILKTISCPSDKNSKIKVEYKDANLNAKRTMREALRRFKKKLEYVASN